MQPIGVKVFQLKQYFIYSCSKQTFLKKKHFLSLSRTKAVKTLYLVLLFHWC